MNIGKVISKYNYMALILVFLILCADLPAFADDTAPSKSKEAVILLHGMGRSYWSMKKVDRFLRDCRYTTFNSPYPSTRESIPELARRYVHPAVQKARKKGFERIHCVTHSLGGIVIRQYLQNQQLPDGSRVVMLAPPNQGSELTDWMKDMALYKWTTGPAGQQLGTDPESLPSRLKPVNLPVGIIAGGKSANPMTARWLCKRHNCLK